MRENEKFSRKRIREFMMCMTNELFRHYVFTREALCNTYKEFAKMKNYPSIENVEDKVNFVNALREYLGDYCESAVNSDTGDRCLSLYNLDPCRIDEWNAVLDKIYTPESKSEILNSDQKVRLLTKAPEMYRILKSLSKYCKDNDIDPDIECDIWEVLTLIDTGKQAKN